MVNPASATNLKGQRAKKKGKKASEPGSNHQGSLP